MSTLQTSPNTLINEVWHQDNTTLRNILLVLAGVSMLWISSRIEIPFYPVPLTLQTLVVLLIGMAYGSRLGTATVVSYLAAGAAGLPVFAGTPEKGISLAYMMGPTGGYLLGFVFAAAVTGWLAERKWDRQVSTTAIAMLLGNIAIYVPGILWLGSIVGWDKPVLAWGLTPFILGDLLKIAIAMALFPSVWRLIGGRKS